MAFQRVPACQQRHLSLLILLEYGIGTLGHEVAVEHHVGHALRRKHALQRVGTKSHRIRQTGNASLFQQGSTGGIGLSLCGGLIWQYLGT